MNKKYFRLSMGFGLIEVMVAIALLAVVAAGISGLGNIQLKQQTQTNVTFQADSFRRQLIANINNANAWKNTYSDAANPSLSCLQSGGNCTVPASGTSGTINEIRDPNNNIYYNGSGSNGITASGAPCTGFNATAGNGSDVCPFQFQIQWVATCTATTGLPNCAAANTQPQIILTAVYNPKSQAKTISFNASNYGAIFYQGEAANSNMACQWSNLGGFLTESCANAVGIGTSSPAHTLDVAGDANFSIGINTPYVTYTSDARLKTDLQPIEGVQAELNSIHPVRFRWNDKAATMGLNDAEVHLGFLAQDVEKYFPEAVKTDRSGIKSVDYAVMVVPAIQAIKELQNENRLLEKRVESLEKTIQSK